jgi:hypothetical protein
MQLAVCESAQAEDRQARPVAIEDRDSFIDRELERLSVAMKPKTRPAKWGLPAVSPNYSQSREAYSMDS